jgi:periodic tryptophan protein 1
MISALAWMPRGKAKPVPTKYEPTEEEMEELRKAADELEKEGDDDEWEDMSDDGSEKEQVAAVTKARKAARAVATGDDDLAEYNLDDYDKEPGDTVGIFGKGLSHFEDNTEDPYITLPDAADDSEEEDDNIIRPTDSIILACHSEEDGHTLEVYVFDYQQGSLFVHHDLMLNAFPLCVEWLDTARKDGIAGSFAALGTMDSAIEVWDLDCIDSLVPAAVLGGEDTAAPAEGVAAAIPKGKKKKKKEPKRPLREGSHRDAVLGLSWNRLQRHVLASASADKSVKIWDVPHERCLHSLTHHAGKVQALQWHPTEAAVLLSGGFDRRAAVVDVRAAAADWRAAARWELAADVECVAWDPHGAGGHLFLVSTDDGAVACFDARRAGAAAVFTIGAHAEAATGMSLNARVPGLLATCSLDKTVGPCPPPALSLSPSSPHYPSPSLSHSLGPCPPWLRALPSLPLIDVANERRASSWSNERTERGGCVCCVV